MSGLDRLGRVVPPLNAREAAAMVGAATSRARTNRKHAGRVVAAFDTLTGYAGVNGAALTLVDTPDGGPSRIKSSTAKSIAISGAATNLEITMPAIVAGNPSGRVDLWLYVSDYAKHNGADVTLFLSVEGAYTNYYTRSFRVRNFNGWQCLSSTLLNLSVGGGSPTLGTITVAKIRFNAPAGAALIVDRLVFGGGGEPLVTMIWDDGAITDYTIIAPLLNKYQMLGNFSIIGSLIADTPSTVMSRTQLKMLAESGHRLVTHGLYNLSNLASTSAAIEDIALNKAYLDALGPDVDSDVYVYPQGEYLHSLGDMAIPTWLESTGFAGAYIASGACVSNENSHDRYICQRKGVDAATVAATWLTQMDEHFAAGMSVALMGHNVVSSGATGAAANLAVIDAVLAGIADRRDAGTCTVVSARDFSMLAMIG